MFLKQAYIKVHKKKLGRGLEKKDDVEEKDHVSVPKSKMEVRVTLLEMKRKLNQNEGNNIIENTLNNKYTFFKKRIFMWLLVSEQFHLIL